jgi:hypothetical protein
LLFGNKISYILDVPNMLHERIIIINEGSSKYKERIFMCYHELMRKWEIIEKMMFLDV